MKKKKILFCFLIILLIILSFYSGYLFHQYSEYASRGKSTNPCFFDYTFAIETSEYVDTNSPEDIKIEDLSINVFDKSNVLIFQIVINKFENKKFANLYKKHHNIQENSSKLISISYYKNFIITKVNHKAIANTSEVTLGEPYPYTLDSLEKDNLLIIN